MANRKFVVDIGANTSQFNQALQEVNNDLKGLTHGLTGINKALRWDPSNMTLLNDKLTLLQSKLESATKKLKVLQEAQSQVAKGSTEWNKLQGQINLVNSEINGLNKQIKATKQAMNPLNQAIKQVGNNFNALGKQSQQFEFINKAVGRVQGALVGLGKNVVKFASSADNLATAAIHLDQISASGEIANERMDALRRTSLRTGKPIDDIGRGVKSLYLAMGDYQAAYKAYNAMTDAILGFGGSTYDAANGVRYLEMIMNGQNLTIVQWQALFNKSPAVMRGVASALGLTDTSARGLQEALRDGTITADQFQKALVEVSADKGFGELANEINTISGGSKVLANGLGLVQGQLASTFSPVIIRLMESARDAILAFSDRIARFLNSGAGQQLNNIMTRLGEVLAGRLSTALDTIGDKIFNLIDRFIEFIEPILDCEDAINELIDTVANIITGIGLFVAALGGLTILVKVATFVKQVYAMVKLLASVIKVAYTAIKVLAAFLGAKLIIAFAAVAAAIAAVILVVRNWGTISTWLRDTWERFRVFITNAFTNIRNNIQARIQEATANMTARFNTFISNVQAIPARIIGFFSGLASRLNLGNFLSIGTRIVNDILAGLASLPSRLAGFIGSAVRGAIAGVGGVGGRILNTMFGSAGINAMQLQMAGVGNLGSGLSNISSKSITNNSTYHIAVQVDQSATSLDIAREIEKIIVRRNS